MSQIGIVGEEVRLVHSVGEHVRKKRDPDAGSPDAGLSPANGRVDRDPFEKGVHVQNPPNIAT
jgi:hypothetical protein